MPNYQELDCEDCLYYDVEIGEEPCSECGRDYTEFIPKNPQYVKDRFIQVVNEVDSYVIQLEFEMKALREVNEKQNEHIYELFNEYSELKSKNIEIWQRVLKLEQQIKRKK